MDTTVKRIITGISDYRGAKKSDGIYVIGKTHSPSHAYGKTIENKVCELTVSCGSGIGGSCWEEYIVENLDNLARKTGLHKFKNIYGEEIVINMANVVKVRKVKVALVSEDITGWKYYGGRHENSEDVIMWYIILGENDKMRWNNDIDEWEYIPSKQEETN